MKSAGIIAIVAGVVVLIFWATSRGLIGSTGVGISRTGSPTGIIAPQPNTNYSGYLAASTAPGVSAALNGALSGLGNAFSSWFGKPQPTQPVAQGTNANSPALAATASAGVASSTVNTANQQYISSLAPATYSDPGSTLVGPQVDPSLQYSGGSAFDYAGLMADNTFDPLASLEAYVSA